MDYLVEKNTNKDITELKILSVDKGINKDTTEIKIINSDTNIICRITIQNMLWDIDYVNMTITIFNQHYIDYNYLTNYIDTLISKFKDKKVSISCNVDNLQYCLSKNKFYRNSDFIYHNVFYYQNYKII